MADETRRMNTSNRIQSEIADVTGGMSCIRVSHSGCYMRYQNKCIFLADGSIVIIKNDFFFKLQM